MRTRLAAALVATVSVMAPGALAAPAALASPSGAAPAASDRAHLEPWWYDALGLERIHRTTTGEGVVVAVIDGYVDPGVADLRGADVTIERGCIGSRTPRLTEPDPRIDHATSMVTLIAGQGAGGSGILGVAPDVEVRTYSMDYLPDNDRLECDSVPSGELVLQAAKDGADIINVSASWGSPVDEDINEALDMGVVIVAATGARTARYTPMGNPARLPGVVGVYAADEQARPWELNPPTRPDFEDYAAITAPGVDIPTGAIFDDGRGWQSGASSTGTSGATALTSGAFALLKARWPEATGNQLVQSMLRNASHSGEEGRLHWDDELAFGLLSIGNAIDVDPTTYPDENPLLVPPQEAVRASAQTDDTQTDDAQTTAEEPEAGTGASEPGAESGAEPAADPAGEAAAVPLPALAAGGLVALALVGGAGLALRRRKDAGTAPATGSTPVGASGTTTSGTTNGTTRGTN